MLVLTTAARLTRPGPSEELTDGGGDTAWAHADDVASDVVLEQTEYQYDASGNVIATVFRGVSNRMESVYLLRDVINKINEIHFTSSEEIHTLGHLYESMLKEMRDAGLGRRYNL